MKRKRLTLMPGHQKLTAAQLALIAAVLYTLGLASWMVHWVAHAI